MGCHESSDYAILSCFMEKAMAPHSSTLAWKIPWMEEPSRLQSMGLLRVRHDWTTSVSLFTFMHCRRKWQPTPVFLPGESQGGGSLVACHLWGLRVGHDWSDLAAAGICVYIYTHTHTYSLACSGFQNNSSEINTNFLKVTSTYIWGHCWSLKKANS